MIGIFDSGSGGLTVLKALREELPSADVLYFGDIKNAPYGSRSHTELSALTVEAIKILQKNGATKIISACNSVSASMALSVLDAFGIDPKHIIEMVGPTVAYFKGSTDRILLCATQATIDSGIYQNAFHMIGKEIKAISIPELAGAVEFASPPEQIEHIIRTSFQDVSLEQYDTLVLACTHYPLVSSVFKSLLPPTLSIFDPAVVVAQRAKKLFWPQEVGGGTSRFLLSKDSKNFRELVAQMLPQQSCKIEIL